ncbi:MAG: amino acid ABC transporter permease [Deltaproteobacteria bacterium]|jgi:polar amino acid transport system permease protein|nr:amino acid ABC transporter permease [Deltaproteobacteria bacterium]
MIDDFPQFLVSALYIVRGTGWTAALILGAMSLGLLVGMPLAALQVYGPKPLRAPLAAYVWFFRGVPILVLLYLVYFGLFTYAQGPFEGFSWARSAFSPFSASLVALGLTSGAYQSQIFRGAILSLPEGQYRAAMALGFTRFGAVTRIVLPQAARLSIPAWSNEYSILLKDSAIAYVLGTSEIMNRARSIAFLSNRILTFFLLAGILYLLLTWLGVRALRALERRLAIPGLGQGEA